MTILKGFQILIVEDEPMLREIYRDELQEGGAVVFEASNGIEALEVLKTKQFDLIITDLNMPKMDGVTLLKEIQKAELHTKTIIVFTGRSDLIRHSPYRRGATAVFDKPMAMGEIATLVKKIIDPTSNRKHPRLIPQNPLSIEIHHLGATITMLIHDISEGGFFIENESVILGKGMPIQFKFSSPLDKSAAVSGEGIVVWGHANYCYSKVPGFGIEIKTIIPLSAFVEILRRI
jgi:two-component system chemotaxis response regulator CheY